MIASLFPDEVVVVLGEDALADAPLHPDEAALAEGMSESRRREFALGRACARAALAKLGAEGPVLRDRRAPRWPDGVVGTLTHTDGFCAAAVARRDAIASLGLDAEGDGPLSEAAARRITTESERAHLATLPPLPSSSWEKLLFSAKEAFYKAYHPLGGSFLGFRDVELRFEPESARFRAEVVAPGKPPPHAATGRYALAPPHVVTAVTLSRGEGY